MTARARRLAELFMRALLVAGTMAGPAGCALLTGRGRPPELDALAHDGAGAVLVRVRGRTHDRLGRVAARRVPGHRGHELVAFERPQRRVFRGRHRCGAQHRAQQRDLPEEIARPEIAQDLAASRAAWPVETFSSRIASGAGDDGLEQAVESGDGQPSRGFER